MNNEELATTKMVPNNNTTMNRIDKQIKERSMNMMMKLLCAAFFILHTPFFISCSDFFETDSDRQVFDPALDEKTDSMFYTLGILKGLQQVGDQYVLVNEMRGDLVATNSYTETDLKRLADFSADATCKYDSAYLYYRIINNCNYYIAHRDTTLLTGSRKVAIPEYAEALAVRAWAYMQLCKTYGSVPFYTTPLTSIGDANATFETKDLRGICDALAPELIRYSGTPVPTYGEISAGVLNSSSSENPEEKKIQSRKAMLPIDVVLADLYLETNQYELAAQYYFKYIKNNRLIATQAYISPFGLFSNNTTRLPADINVISNYNSAIPWGYIFYVGSTSDIVTYIPLAANQLRGVTTDLPRIFGYDFYSTTSGDASSSSRYLLERQIDASQSYTALSNSQLWYYRPRNSTTMAKTLNIGDLRRPSCFQQAVKEDSTFSVMIKFTTANIPLYRNATIYLRLAEAINRMGYPDAAFAILKDGIKDETTQSYDYFREGTLSFLKTTVPFLSNENKAMFDENSGIHARGTNYTQGTFSPYQMDSVVTAKFRQLEAENNIVITGTFNDTINAMEDIICDEMALELAFEGTRFGDLTRIARHKNQAGTYNSNFGNEWLERKLRYKNPTVSLLDERNWYLPFK